MSLLRYFQTVLWSFIGIGRRKDMARAAESAHPLGLIAVAVLLVGVFIAVLMGVVQLVVRHAG
jgi:hypothetical protein